ncbi:MAG: M3 family oligoendopeptidase [Chlamydiales bacterium]
MRQSWNLKSLYDEAHFDTFLLALRKQIFEFKKLESMEEKLLLAQELRLSIHQASSFANCLLAVDTNHKRAHSWESCLRSISCDLEKIWMEIDVDLLNMSDEEMKSLGETAIQFPLKERRDLAKLRLDVEQEQLICDLSVDGYHSWGHFYDSFIATLAFPLDGENLSAAQIATKITSSDRNLRNKALASYKEIYSKNAPIIARFLNHLAGFRLRVQENRSWQSAIDHPLLQNRMSIKTLNSMWEAVTNSRSTFVQYFKRKAEILEVEKLSWFDINAPLQCEQNNIPYESGVKFIIDQFAKVSPKMADFTKHAVDFNWIDSENRSGKKPGTAYFTFPFTKETRIFLTYTGTWNDIYILSNLLGHSFHCNQIHSLPELAQHYRRNVGEVSSTMSETIISKASIQLAKNHVEKIALLDNRICRSLQHLLDVQARYLFESRFIEKRKERYLGPEELNALMIEAQQECFSNSLSEYNPLLWTSKPHLFITDTPFYNFPYTFGQLLSAGIFERIKNDPAAFESTYIPLLHDSGMMTSEDLLKKHLAVDIEKPEFWQESVNAILKDVEEFIKLTTPAHL